MSDADNDEIVDIEYLRALVKLQTKYSADVYSQASAYENVIIVAGYAAFFGLWVGVSGDVSRACRTVTAAMMGSSLFAYICWHLTQMVFRQRQQEQRFAILAEWQDDPVTLFERANELEHRQRVESMRYINKIWPPVFKFTVATGLAGAIVLIWNTAMVAMALPLQLTG